MKTFGELVTQIKHELSNLCLDLLGPGAAQALGPAHAYGKSFLIFQSVRTLQEAIQIQENHLKARIEKEGSFGAIKNDTKSFRVVDSIYQSLNLIDRYCQDPTRFTQQGIVEWFKQEATNCGLSSMLLGEELDISGKGITLELKLTGQESISSACLIYVRDNERVEIPELVEMIQQNQKTHVSHLLSMAARLDVIESENQSLMNLTQPLCEKYKFQFKRSLGGLRFPFIEGFEAVLTLDSYEPNRIIPMIVIDPPIVFPVNQLKEISSLSSVRFNVELSVSSFISAMLKLHSDVNRSFDGKAVRLLLNDESVPSIMLARLPLTRFDSFESVLDCLKTAATWCSVIREVFSTKEEVESNISIDVAPSDDFTLAITYWVQDNPARLVVKVNPDGSLETDDDNLNAQLGPTRSFASIISNLIQ